ncbi:MAG: homoserine kinase [Bacteroidetes bacterium]|nr:homoserine kinase [Bacteroidota bacterium]MDA0859508.1 homoserine kinase [Bacteroidota bacterium]MDA1317905.1 homoserine kinase [Bacteroidota bacterium]
MKEVKIFSPGTVANVGCGFDVLGFCLDAIGDEMIIRKTPNKGVHITKIEGGYDLPFNVNENVAGVSALALYQDAQPDFGFEIEIYKNIKPGSGIGSSAASAAGSVFGINYLLGNPYANQELTTFAMKGEAIASKSEHADNIAPALFGGFTLVKSNQPLEVLQIPTPKELYAVIAHQKIEIKTSEARSILPKDILLSDAIVQWSNLGSLIHALHTNDYALIGRSLKDVVVEPHRSKLIPNYKALKNSALDANALGTSISGSGPSVFSLCKGESVALQVKNAQKQLLKSTQIPFEIYVSKINTQGIRILTQ